jgi:hypothetical protein
MSIGKAERKRISAVLLLSGFFFCSSGCSMFRGIEQWKCDHWGVCHFGTAPQASAATSALPPLGAPEFAPPEPCEPVD